MASSGQLVLAVDVDSFFVQVEQLRHSQLRNKAVAIQQHQDIIAANHAAKAAGVKKHMAPAEARRLLSEVGGIVWHVHCEAGGRVSYKPYREASRKLIATLQQQPCAAIVEKASIDEAYILHARTVPGGKLPMEVGLRSAASVQCAVLQATGLEVSIGVARNKLLAKLASLQAKPYGITGVDVAADVAALLARTSVLRLPGCNGKLAPALEAAGIRTVQDLQAWSAERLRGDLGVRAELATQLEHRAHGRDDSAVAPRAPPKSLSVKMSLTPVAVRMYPGQNGSLTGDKDGMLTPLLLGEPDFRPRLRAVLQAMAQDLMERVHEDAAEHHRWPQGQGLMLNIALGSHTSKLASRSCAFPVATGGNVEQVVQRYLHNAEKLAQTIAQSHPGTAAVTQIQLEASSFSAAAAGAKAITSFFTSSRAVQTSSQPHPAELHVCHPHATPAACQHANRSHGMEPGPCSGANTSELAVSQATQQHIENALPGAHQSHQQHNPELQRLHQSTCGISHEPVHHGSQQPGHAHAVPTTGAMAAVQPFLMANEGILKVLPSGQAETQLSKLSNDEGTARGMQGVAPTPWAGLKASRNVLQDHAHCDTTPVDAGASVSAPLDAGAAAGLAQSAAGPAGSHGQQHGQEGQLIGPVSKEDTVDLSTVDVAEQQRILQVIQQQAAKSKRRVDASAAAEGQQGPQRRKAAVGAGSKQRSIADMFRR